MHQMLLSEDTDSSTKIYASILDAAQLIDDPACGALAEGGGRAHAGAVAVAVERAVAFDGARGIGRGDGLAAEDAGDADALAFLGCAVFAAQAVAQLGQQRVVRGGAEVVDIDLVSQALAARCTHGDEALPRGTRMGCHGGLGLDLVAGVDDGVGVLGQQAQPVVRVNEVVDRKSTRLNSSHLVISYAVFCLKKKKNI